MTDPTPSTASAAPGWYPDASGAQRWWDGRGWTDHVAAPVAAAGAYARPQLPAGTKTDTVWIWIVALATFLCVIPMFFLDMNGYIRATISLETGSYRGFPPEMANFFAVYALTMLLSVVSYGLTILAAFRDYKHLIRVGAVRPFHWAFAFIPYTLVYLIGRHVVLRKMVRTSGAPLWVHIAMGVVYVVAVTIWTMAMMQSMFSELGSLYSYDSFN